jgi:hypothetical protein
MSEEKKVARRYNNNKLRYELISSIGLEKLAEVYTKGAAKYTLFDEDGNMTEDGANNWRSGLPWMSTIASVKRHIQQWCEGQEVDDDLKTQHLANAAWGLFALMEYQKTHPELDDRPHNYLKIPKIALDIDDVICDFVPAYRAMFGGNEPTAWNFSYKTSENFKVLTDDPKLLKEFYSTLKPKINPVDIPFEPHAYITSRSVPIEITKQWIADNGFPCSKVYTVPFNASKLDVMKESGAEIMVDDKFDTFAELNNAGICCYLFDAPWNQRYSVGYRRIFDLKNLY